MFSKFASLEVGEVLEVRSSPTRVEDASLDRYSSYNDYRTDDGFIYTRVRAISSRVNKNYDGWPSEELQKAYRTFIGKPIFVDHNNSNTERSRGVIVDATLHVEDGKSSTHDSYYSTAPDNHKPPTWIELLLETDASAFPKLAKAIVDGDIDGVSMGCFVAGALITLSDGTRKPIEDIVVGDRILTHEGTVESVTYFMKRWYTGNVHEIVGYGHSEKALITDEHPVWIRRSEFEGWIDAKDVRINDYIMTPSRSSEESRFIPKQVNRKVRYTGSVPQSCVAAIDGAVAVAVRSPRVFVDEGKLYRKIKEIRTTQHEGFVYNFDVEGADSYVAGNMSVHNCNVERTRCSVCSNWAYAPEDFCTHVKLKGAHFDSYDHMGRKSSKLAWEDCYDVGFFEISYVFDPADETALVHEVKTAKTAAHPYYDDEYINPEDNKDTAPDLTEVPHWSLDSSDPTHQVEMERRRNDPPDPNNPVADDVFKVGPAPHEPSATERVGPPGADAFTQYLQRAAPQSEFTDAGGGPVDTQSDLDMFPHPDDPRSQTALATASYPEWTNEFADVAVDKGYTSPEYIKEYSKLWQLSPEQVQQAMNDAQQRRQSSTFDSVLKEAGFKLLAENPLPQSMELTIPDHVDTLRQEKVCPICGSEMDSGECAVCHYVEPPAGFDNPDLGLAQQVRDMIEESGENLVAGGQPPEMAPPGGGMPPGMPGNAGDPMPGTPGPPTPGTMAATNYATNPHEVKDEWGIVIRSRVASRIDKRELPILPPTRVTTDLPQNPKVVTNSSMPVESNTKDNTEIMSNWNEIAKKLESRNLDPRKVAALADAGVFEKLIERLAADAVAEPADFPNTDVDSRAQLGGDPTKDADHVEVDKPLKEEVGDKTKTWGDNSAPAVTSEDGSVGQGPIGSPIHSTQKNANPIPGSETPWKADAQIDVEKPLNTEEVGEKTKTWGDDKFHTTDPVTTDGSGNDMGGPIGQAISSAKTHWMKSLKVAETEIDLGVLTPEEKYDRVAILDGMTPQQVEAVGQTLAMVRKANLRKAKAMPKTVPGLGQVVASTQGTSETSEVNDDSALFIR